VSSDDERYADDELLRESSDDILDRAPAATPRPSGRLFGLWGWVAVIIVVFLGVAVGSWLGSSPTPAPSSDASPAVVAPTDTTTPEPSVDPQVRIPELQAQIAANPNDVNARLELGVLLYNEDSADPNARDQWLAVTQIDPTNETAWYNLGFYYLSTTPPECAKAADAWNTVITLDPTGENANQIQSHMAGLMPQVCPSEATAAPGTPVTSTTSPAPSSGG